MKTAIIDVGSNTIRLSVYNTFEDGTFELLFSKKETAGLAGYIRHGRMSCGGNRQLILRYSPYASPSTGWQKIRSGQGFMHSRGKWKRRHRGCRTSCTF